jgi:precorrin-2 dehydrogenase / sirohydrochlorin ferrochelatase
VWRATFPPAGRRTAKMAERTAAEYYPVLLDLRGRTCAVIGGGAVAEGKVDRLIAAGARVTVVSPSLTARLAAWAGEGRLRHVARAYAEGDLAGQALAFVAVDHPAVAAAVAEEARRLGIWVNAADDPARCDFILPSVLRRGRLVVSVSTGGASPGLARAIREDLEERFTAEFGALIDLVAEVRSEVRASTAAVRATGGGAGATDSGARVPAAGVPAAAWRHALDPALRRLVAGGRRDEAKSWLHARLQEVACR